MRSKASWLSLAALLVALPASAQTKQLGVNIHQSSTVGPAIAQLHARPAHPWTLEELARTIASSRSVLAERFTRVVGVAPMLYLTRWRLQLAAERLARGSAKVAAIGVQVGYDSEAAFSRAFKRETGHSPAEWRRSHRAAS